MFGVTKIAFSLLLIFLVVSVHAKAGDDADLNRAVHAYSESKDLGHKADTFLHAQTAYKLARKQYGKSPADLAIHTYRYAVAAASYREPIALSLFEETLGLLVQAYGHDAAELSLVLIDAADESLTRNEPEKAYAWYDKAHDIIARDQPNGSIEMARAYMGLARMYSNSGEHERAQTNAEKAITLLDIYQNQAAPVIIANLYFWHGQIMRALKLNTNARESYLNALRIFERENPDARKVLSIHTHLVEVNYKLNDPDALTFHCHAAALYQHQRRRGMWFPLYDPAGRLDLVHQGKQQIKTGEIVASYVKTASCRLRDITILGTAGISKADAKIILSGALFAPRYRGNEIIERRTDQSILPVYGQASAKKPY